MFRSLLALVLLSTLVVTEAPAQKGPDGSFRTIPAAPSLRSETSHQRGSLRPLADVLDAEGRIRTDRDGGFDASGFAMSIAPDGAPQFHTAARAGNSNDWLEGFFIGPGVGRGNVQVIAVDGDDLYVGGSMKNVAGLPNADMIARYNRAERQWYALGSGLDRRVYQIVVDGDDVYVGGMFTHEQGNDTEMRYVGRWSKSEGTWSPLGAGVMRPDDPHYVERGVGALRLIDGKLWVGGYYVNAGGIAEADVLALWDTEAEAWESLGQMYTIDGYGEATVDDIEPIGDRVYVNCYCGFGEGIVRHAFYDGEEGEWQPLPVLSESGTTQWAETAVIDTDIYLVRGQDGFQGLPGIPDSTHAVRYDGTEYTALAGTLPERSVPTFVGSFGGDVVLGLGTKSSRSEHPYLMRHDGSGWIAFGPDLASQVATFIEADGELWLGGYFRGRRDESQLLYSLARFDGTEYHPVGPTGNGLTGTGVAVEAFVAFQGEFYIGGSFRNASGDRSVNNIARWDGERWQPVGDGLNRRVNVFLPVNDRLYVGGDFTDVGGVSGAHRLAQFDGTSWTPFGEGFGTGDPRAMAILGDDLYVGGSFYRAGDVRYATNIARWDGSEWHALTEWMQYDDPNDDVEALLVENDSTLLVGGQFTSVYGWPYLARWDPEQREWSGLAEGAEVPNGTVLDLLRDGDVLYVAGEFTDLGDDDADGLAMWDGTEWSSVGGGLTGPPDHFGEIQEPNVRRLHLVDGDLYVGGNFSRAGDVPGTANIARWDGEAWHALSSGLDGRVTAIGSHEGLLWVGGGGFEATGDNQIATRGIAAHPLPSMVAVEAPPETAPTNVAVWPNPSTPRSGRVQVTLGESQAVRLTVHDVLGRQVALLFAGEAGRRGPIEFELPELSSGVYFVRLVGERETETVPITIVR